MSKETFTRENLIDHMQRLAYHGVGAAVGIGDLVDRSDMKGGRTGWGDVPLRLREEVVPGAALFKTAGVGMAWPGAGAQGHRSRADVMYFVIDRRRGARGGCGLRPHEARVHQDSGSTTATAR